MRWNDARNTKSLTRPFAHLFSTTSLTGDDSAVNFDEHLEVVRKRKNATRSIVFLKGYLCKSSEIKDVHCLQERRGERYHFDDNC